ncbi:MAG: hypothetical protein GXP25_07235 [Planctomycetes bacterium]|nr:hypothetical protein [Planctomycetota bacterium]
MKRSRRVMLGLALLAVMAMPARAERRSGRMAGPMGKLAEIRDPLEEVRQEIVYLNLINGLNLTPEQLAKIVKLADRRDMIVKSYAPRASALTREAKPLLAELKSTLEQQKEVPEDLAQRVTRINHRDKRLRQELMAQLARAGEEIEDILTDAQLTVVESYEPCVVLPPDRRDPVRAGQASNSAIGEEMLRRIRSMSDQEFRTRGRRMVDYGIERVSRNQGRLSSKEKAEERKRLLALVNKARAMSDTEFEMKKEELAKEFKPKQKIKDLQHQINEARIGTRISRAAQLLMNPTAIKVLRKRAKQMDVALK